MIWAAKKMPNPWIAQDERNKSTRVGLVMTMSARVWISSLMSTVSIRWWKELNVIEKNACSCFHPMWKLTSCAIATKVSQIALEVPMHSLLWVQHKRWIPTGSMGCVHTHRKILVIKKWRNPNYIWNVLK